MKHTQSNPIQFFFIILFILHRLSVRLVSAYKYLCLFLDVYVFGIGTNVKRTELKSLASSKIRERHLFILNSYKDLGEVFNRMISE